MFVCQCSSLLRTPRFRLVAISTSRAVVQFGGPVAAALWREVQDVPHGVEEVDAALRNVLRQGGVGGVEVPHASIGPAGEDGHRGVLVAVFVLTAKVVLETAVAGA